MTTKERLVKDGEQANVAFLKLKQKYKPHDQQVYLIVEGKDDIAYYTCISVRYCKFANSEIICANNRDNVIRAYDSTDWNVFSKDRVFFFVDRDLSDITGEHTPVSQNVYITDDYSIENSLFNEQLLFTTLKVFCGLNDLNDEEIEVLSNLYQTAQAAHAQVFLPIMSWILCWRMNKASCNLNNLNSGNFFRISQGLLELKDEYRVDGAIESVIHSSCGVQYIPMDISRFSEKIISHGGIQKYIRGKYVRAFFVKFLNSIVESLPAILPGRSKPRTIVTFGQGNILQLLCGYMITPNSLDTFLSKASS